MRALAAIIIVALTCIPAFAQSTRSPDERAKENRELKDYIAKLEERVRTLNKREADLRQQLQRRYFEPFAQPPRLPKLVPPPPPPTAPAPSRPPQGPYFWLPETPRLPDLPNRLRIIPPATQPAIPPGSHKYRFNGQDVYVIPLE